MSKGNQRGTGNPVRLADTYAWGSGRARNGVRQEPAGATPFQGGNPVNGGVRPSVEELRRHAELVRAIEPTSARRRILDLAITLGRDTREIETWTFGDAHYVTRTMLERLNRAK